MLCRLTACLTLLIAGDACLNRNEIGQPSVVLFVDPESVPADGVSAAAIDVLVVDSKGHGRSGATVVLSCSGSCLVTQPAPTGSLGTSEGAIRSTVVGRQAVVASLQDSPSGTSATAFVDFTALTSHAASSRTSTIVCSPSTVTTDNNATTTVTVTLRDSSNAPVSGTAITLSASGSNTYFGAVSGSTDAQGVFSTSLYSPTAQTEQITASGTGFSMSAAVTFTAGAVANGSFSISPNQVTVSTGLSHAALSVTLTDMHGNAIPNAEVTFSANGSSNTFSPSAQGSTDAFGVFNATVSSTKTQVETISARSSGTVNLNGNLTFQAGSPNATLSSFTASPNILAANSNATLALSLCDDFNNVIPNAAVSFSSASGNLSIAPATGSTTSAGSFVGAVTSSVVQTVQVLASGVGYAYDANVSFNAGETRFGISGMDVYLAIGQSSNATVTVYTAQGNVATLYTGTITFSSSDPSATLAGPYTFTAADAGVHTFASAITVQTVGTQSLTAADANGTTGSEPNIIVTQYVVANAYMSEESDSVCVLLNNQQIKCWGDNPNGSLGYGDYNIRGLSPNTMGPNLPFVNMGNQLTVVEACTSGSDGRYGHTCAVVSDGNVMCWGANANGQLGYGDLVQRNKPVGVEVALGASPVQHIRCGQGHSCALDANSQVHCWGLNASGQLGLGDFSDRSQPFLLPPPPSRTWADIELGSDTSCGLLDNGTVTCWGLNGNGQLGYGDFTTRKTAPITPLALSGGNQAIGLSLGATFSCAILPNQQVSCWGANDKGQLGLGDNSQRNISTLTVAIPGNPAVASVTAAGASYVCALTTTGLVYCWGYNLEGELGLENKVNQNAPTAAANLGTQRSAQSLVTGNVSSCVILDDKTTKCWGIASHGALGLGDSITRGGNPNTMGDYLPTVQLW